VVNGLKWVFPDGSWSVVKTGLCEHPAELALGPHVNGKCDELAITVEDEALRDTVDMKALCDFASGVEQDGIGDLAIGDERCDLGGVFLGNGEDDEALLLKMIVKGFEVGHLLAAGRAPGCPEVDQDHLAVELLESPLFAGDVGEGEVDFLNVGFLCLKQCLRFGQLLSLEICGDVFIADELG